MSEHDDVEDVGEDPADDDLRQDFKHVTSAGPADAPKRKRGRPRKIRNDSPLSVMPIDGFGDPFRVLTKPGWVVKWVTDDFRATHQMWPWEVARWNDDRIVSCTGLMSPSATSDDDDEETVKKTTKKPAIKYKGYTCMLMKKEHADWIKQNDPSRSAHRARIQYVKEKARNSAVVTETGQVLARGEATKTEATVNIEG